MIPFNKPHFTGKETEYIIDAVNRGKISGDGYYTEKCHSFFTGRYGFKKVLLTTSCTDALEMTAILLNISPGDEVIMPSYTFVSTANAFVLRGAKIIFVDSNPLNPNLDVDLIEEVITSRTKAIVVVHYAGIACDMDRVMEIANKHGIYVVEDAAQAIDSFYKGNPLGGIGHLGVMSFHETKNVISGEGGMLIINDSQFFERAEIVREKGTNRTAFFRGQVNKYGWVDIGSSYLPSEIIAAFLFAQLENLDDIQRRRIEIWNRYFDVLSTLSGTSTDLPFIPPWAMNNGHIFYIVASSLDARSRIIKNCVQQGIHVVFHYLSLHCSPYYSSRHDGRVLTNADRYSSRLLRLPLYYSMSVEDQNLVLSTILNSIGN